MTQEQIDRERWLERLPYKNKALELVINIKELNLSTWINNEDAKKIALIAVDEIINQLENLHKPEYTTFINYVGENEIIDGYELIEYYKEVKQEIENL
jgi:hypothetical protein